MRSDRKSEKEFKKQKKKNTKIKGFSRFLSIIYTLAVLCFIGLLIWLNVVPAKYLYPIIGILIVISLFIAPVMFSRNGKPGRRKVAMIIASLLIVVFGVGIYYLNTTLDFFNSITSIGGAREDFYLIVNASSSYEEAKDIEGKTVGVHTDTESTYSEAKKELKKEVDIEYEYVNEMPVLIDSLVSGERPAIFISAASYESMRGQNSLIEEKVKIIYKISIRVESRNTTDHVNVTKEPFNIFVSGIDTEGSIDTVSRSDVNMIITVNPKTKRILMTSIPRDSYVKLASKGASDKLTHSGIYGVNETVATVEDFMGIDINYYVKVNYSTVIKLVDAIGGIDINSPFGFYTHGMKAKYYFQEGYNHLDGSQALAYSRERYSFSEGDIQRNKNQQLILSAIIEKATSSSTILSEYTSILNAIKDNIETDMEKKSMTSLIKMQINDMSSWTIERQSITGENGNEYCYALGMNAAVVIADEVSIAQAVDKIIEVQTGETTE
ncbi:MAG: hypothetical protein HFE74_08155 [Firmicutes bacterium]|jgi:LCP family protein required for cell wall assembly|nr:hypothetical protein [Bacillota bacterium]